MISIVFEESKKLIGQKFFRVAIFVFFLILVGTTYAITQNDYEEIEIQNQEKEYVANYRTELKNSIENILENIGSPLIRNNHILKNSLLNQATEYKELNKESLNLKYDEEKGLEYTINTTYLDILVIVIISVSGFLIFNFERTYLTNNIINSIKNGGKNRAKSKIYLMLILSIIIPYCVYGFLLFYVQLTKGFGDLSRNIQSLIIFRDASLNINVGQYLIIFMGQKVLSSIYFTFISIIILSILKDVRIQIIGILLFLLISYITFAFIGRNTIFDMLKYASVFSLFDVADIFGRYSDVYIYIGFLKRHIYSLILFFLISLVCGIIGYKFLSEENDNNSSLKVANFKINYPKRLFTFEAYRLFIKSYGLIFIILIATYAFTHIPVKGPSEYDFVKYMYDYSINEFGGKVDSSTIENIKNKKVYYENIKTEINNISEKLDNKEINEHEATLILQDLENEASKEIGFNLVEKQVNDSYNITDRNENLFLLDKEIGEFNFEYNPYVLITSIVFYLLIILIISETFVVDQNKGIDKLIKSTKNGHLKTLKYRKMLSYIYILMAFILSQIFIFLTASSLGYTLEPKAVVQSVPSLLMFGININYIVLYFIYILYAIINIFFIANVIIFINQKYKDRIPVYLILMAITILPNLIGLFFKNLDILGLIPTGNILSINFTFSRFSFYGYIANILISAILVMLLKKINKKEWINI